MTKAFPSQQIQLAYQHNQKRINYFLMKSNNAFLIYLASLSLISISAGGTESLDTPPLSSVRESLLEKLGVVNINTRTYMF